MTYTQEGLAQKLDALNVQLDGTIEIPWMIDSTAIMDSSGNILAVATSNVFGGTTFTGTGSNVIGFTTPNALGGENIYNGYSENVGFTTENVYGGQHLYNQDSTLESVSFDTPIGETLFTSDMEIVGIDPKHGEYLAQTNVSGDAIFGSFANFETFSSYTHSINPDFSVNLGELEELESMSNLDVSAPEGLDILDWI